MVKKKKKKICLQCRRPWFDSPGQEDSPGEGNGNPLQYSCVENLKDRGARWQDSRASTTITGVFCVLFSPEGLSFSINISENEELLKKLSPAFRNVGCWSLIQRVSSPPKSMLRFFEKDIQRRGRYASLIALPDCSGVLPVRMFSLVSKLNPVCTVWSILFPLVPPSVETENSC